jgi:hypothetical protein
MLVWVILHFDYTVETCGCTQKAARSAGAVVRNRLGYLFSRVFELAMHFAAGIGGQLQAQHIGI